MKKRDVAFMLAALEIVAATMLEIFGINPADQVIAGLLFGFTA